uniref:Uncharacterized protein n=1 Tax=Anguilla anguilla TaxID=7936 RepID=A0A0E9RQB2_ANGAN
MEPPKFRDTPPPPGYDTSGSLDTNATIMPKNYLHNLCQKGMKRVFYFLFFCIYICFVCL